jgi:hypothetical protein
MDAWKDGLICDGKERGNFHKGRQAFQVLVRNVGSNGETHHKTVNVHANEKFAGPRMADRHHGHSHQHEASHCHVRHLSRHTFGELFPKLSLQLHLNSRMGIEHPQQMNEAQRWMSLRGKCSAR